MNNTYRPKLLYFVAEDWYFCSHRLMLAKTAIQAGYDVFVLTHVTSDAEKIIDSGIHLIPLEIRRGGINPWRELKTLGQVLKVYRQLKPDIVHHVALKPVLYGSTIAIFSRKLKVINMLAGLGAIFSSNRLKAKILKPFVQFFLSVLLRQSSTFNIVQNNEDVCLMLHKLKIPASKVKLIKGSGVNIKQYYATPEPPAPISIALVSRLLWDKGVGEFVAAVSLLKQKGLQFEAYLVGNPDPENMASINPKQIQLWVKDDLIHWLGHIEDIPQLWRTMHIAVLPSYREGLPKSLLEAAASARPIVTTDTSGCREIVDDGINGFLVPVRNIPCLAEAMEKLILNSQLRYEMGQAGRHKVEQELTDDIVIQQTLKLYSELSC